MICLSMYGLSAIGEAVNNPSLVFRGLNKLYYTRFGRRPYNTTGVNIFEEDWDNLLILDACRYDLFKQANTLPGRLESRRSRGGNTVEFLFGNFCGRDLHDTVYITANPQYYRHRDDIEASFHAVIDIWNDEGWDENLRTVPPEVITERCLDAAEIYPNKRLIAHYIQPHYPFINYDITDWESDQAFLKPDQEGAWEQIVRDEIDVSGDELWDAYRSNLEIALPHVERLIDLLQGQTVVTSDHGNMVGERARPFPNREWGHMQGLYTKELVKVPWLICNEGAEKTIVAESPAEPATEIDDSKTVDRLQDLGYL